MTAQPTWATVCATGHRPQHFTPEEKSWVRAELPRIVAKLRDEHGMTVGVSGMAIGVDMWWAAELVAAGVPLWAHVPFPQQSAKWTRHQHREWLRLLNLATDKTLYADEFSVAALHARNDGMLAVSQAVVAVWKPSKTDGGTASAVKKADARGLPIVHLNPESRRVSLRSPHLPALVADPLTA